MARASIPYTSRVNLTRSCILFHFYIKPQQDFNNSANLLVVSYSISTSNHNVLHALVHVVVVVSYSISTSNHNEPDGRLTTRPVVSYSISTSNHNYTFVTLTVASVVSYSISTSNHNPVVEANARYLLYLIPFLHQTTTIISITLILLLLYLIPFLHQTTTRQS